MTRTLAHKPILIASDLSARSDRAVRRGFALARHQSLPVVLVTAVDDALPDDMAATMTSKAHDNLDRLAASISEGMEYTVRTAAGDPTEALLETVKDVDPSLLVVGEHRRRAFFDSLRETTMQRVVRLSDCPVLVVRDPVDHDYSRVLAACDFSPASTAAICFAASMNETTEIQPIHALQMPYGGRLAGHANAREELEKAYLIDARKMEKEWRAGLSQDKLAAETLMKPGAPFGLIQHYVENNDVDLLCVGAHGRVGSAQAILGSLATDLIRDPPRDLLIARP